MTLADGRTGRKYIIAEVRQSGAYRRLHDLGFTPGTAVEVLCRAAFGGTLLVALRGYVLAVRENAGANIVVTEPSGSPRGGK